MPILREDDNWPNVKKSQHPIKDILKYALMIGLVWLAHELSKDYCVEQGRKLTDKEYLTIAFNYFRDHESESLRMKVHDWDNTLDSYLLHHPGCCSISKEYGLLSPITTEVTVAIYYEKTDEAKTRVNGVEYGYYLGIIRISDCGSPYYPSGESMPTRTTGFYQQKI